MIGLGSDKNTKNPDSQSAQSKFLLQIAFAFHYFKVSQKKLALAILIKLDHYNRHPEEMQPLLRHSKGVNTVSKQLSDHIFVHKWLRNKLLSFLDRLDLPNCRNKVPALSGANRHSWRSQCHSILASHYLLQLVKALPFSFAHLFILQHFKEEDLHLLPCFFFRQISWKRQ